MMALIHVRPIEDQEALTRKIFSEKKVSPLFGIARYKKADFKIEYDQH